MNRQVAMRLAFATGLLIVGLYATLWLLSYATFGMHYPSGEPIQRSFETVPAAVLSIVAGILAAILIPYLPGKADAHRRR